MVRLARRRSIPLGATCLGVATTRSTNLTKTMADAASLLILAGVGAMATRVSWLIWGGGQGLATHSSERKTSSAIQKRTACGRRGWSKTATRVVTSI